LIAMLSVEDGIELSMERLNLCLRCTAEESMTLSEFE